MRPLFMAIPAVTVGRFFWSRDQGLGVLRRVLRAPAPRASRFLSAFGPRFRSRAVKRTGGSFQVNRGQVRVPLCGPTVNPEVHERGPLKENHPRV